MNWWDNDPTVAIAEPEKWWDADPDDKPARASLAEGFDTSLNLPDIGGDTLVGGAEGTEGMQLDRATGKLIPIYRALPTGPKQRVQLDTQGVDARQTRPEYEADLRDNGWEEDDPAGYGVVTPLDAVPPSSSPLINAKRVFEASVGGGTADALGAFLKAGRDLDDKTGGAVSGALESMGIDARGLNEEIARWARQRKSAQRFEKGVNPELEDTALAKVAGGFGSLPPVVVTSLVNPALGYAVGGGMMAESERQDAEKAGASGEQQDTTFYANAAVGAITERLLGVRSLWRAAQKAGIPAATYKGLVRNVAEGAARGYLREGTQEGLEQYASNEIAKTIAAWDPDRSRTEGVGESALIGGVVGAPVGAIAQGLQTRRMPAIEREFTGTAPDSVRGAPSVDDAVARFGAEQPRPAANQPAPESLSEGMRRFVGESTQRTARRSDRETRDAEFDRIAAHLEESNRDQFLPDRKPLEQPEIEPELERQAHRDYEAELLADADIFQRESGDELLDAISASGGLPVPSSEVSGPYRGELRNVLEMSKGGRHVGVKGVFTGKLFRKDAPDVDTLATSLRDRGFDVQTPADVFNLLDQRLRTGRAIYGVPERAATFKRSSSEHDPAQGVLPFDGNTRHLRGEELAADQGASPEAETSSIQNIRQRARQRWHAVTQKRRTLAGAIRSKATDDALQGAGLTTQRERVHALRELERYSDDAERGADIPSPRSRPHLPIYLPDYDQAPEQYQRASRVAHELASEALRDTGLTAEELYFERSVDPRSGQRYALDDNVRLSAQPDTQLERRQALGRLAKALEQDKARAVRGVRGPARLQPVHWPARQSADRVGDAGRSSAPESNLAAVRLAELAAERNGQKVVWFRDLRGEEQIDGATFPVLGMRYIFLNVDALKDPVIQVAAHELTHRMKVEAPDVYRRYEAAVRRATSNDYDANRKTRGYADAQLDEEFMADFTAEAIQNPVRLKALLNEDPTVYERIMGYLRDIIEGITRAYRDKWGKGSPVASDSINNLRQAHAAMEQAFREWQARRPDEGDAETGSIRAQPTLARSDTHTANLAAYRALSEKRDSGTITPAESQKLENIERELGQEFIPLGEASPLDRTPAKPAVPQFRGADTAEDVDGGLDLGPFEDADGQQAFFKREELSPEEALFRGPVIEGRLTRFFFEGSRDVFDRTPGLKFLGAAIRKHVDQARKYDAALLYPYRKWEQKYGRAERQQALSDFESYWGQHATNPAKVDRFLQGYSQASKDLIQLWRETAKYADERNAGVTVYDDGKQAYRPIGSIADYFPRSVRPEIWEMVEHGVKNRAQWTEMVAALKEQGMITDEREAIPYLERALKPIKRFDYLGNIEQARNLPLPNRAYDYSFRAARRYMKAWAERKAQIEAFGQKLGKNGKDLFDVAAEKTHHRLTREYIMAVQKRAYGEVPNTALARTAAFLNTLATPLHLANPRTIGRNLFSGLLYNQTTFGTGNAIRAAFEMRRAWQAIDDAYAKGILSHDLMNMVNDADQLRSKPIAKLQRASNAVFRLTGYSLSEDFVRAHALLTAKAFLRQAIAAFNKDPRSRAAMRYAAFLKRNGHNIAKLAEENGEGELTDRYLRESVNLSQGGYRYDQVPVFTDSPVGRFIYKYQKWGTQATRNFVRNVLTPAAYGTELTYIRDGKRHTIKTRDFQPLTRYVIATALVGQAILGIEEWIFGSTPGVASIDEIIKTWNTDKKRALEIALSRYWKGIIASGGYGIISNYAQHLIDYTERRGSQNPMNPPALGTLLGTLDLAARLREQGTLTARDLEDFLNSQVSIYRTGKDMAARVANAAGSTAEWQKEEIASHDLRWLNTVTRRYASEVGEPGKRTAPGRVAKTPNTPFENNLHDALIIGDVQGVKSLLRERLRELTPAQREAFLKSVKASVRARQPIRVGTAGAERRELFLQWAKKRLPADELARVRRIDATYYKTARAAGLMSDPKPVDLNEAIRNMQMRRALGR